MKTIVCPTDFSAGSEQAARVAVRLATDQGAELVLVHAWFIPPPASVMDSPYPPALIQAIVDDAQRLLEAAVTKAKEAGAPRVRGELRSGPAGTAIADTLEGIGADLCVIGTHGRTGVTRVLLGSVAEQVVRHAPCSVMAVHPDGEVKHFKHALVPTDFSPSARHAVELATQLVAPGGSIMLLHVLELPARFSGEVPMAAFHDEMNKRTAIALGREADALRTKTPLDVQTRLRIGYPGREILDVLDEDRSFDLIVTGSHGRTGLKRVLLGSVAEKLVRHARCPVLVARLERDEGPADGVSQR